MKIELKNVKHAAFASEETNCFTATIYVDGVKAGEARNSGHGGMTMIMPHELEQKIAAYAKTLPPVTTDLSDPHDPSKMFTYEASADSVIDDLLTEHLIAGDLKRAMSKRIMFTKAGSKGIFETKSAKADQIKVWLLDPKLVTKLGADKVLNLLPFEEALAIYKEAAA